MTSTPAIADDLTSFVPGLILRRLVVDPSPLPLPHAENFSGAVLFADISGFTALTERLAEQGRSGVEELTQILNEYFGWIITVVDEHGGDVLKFAGDALLALWKPTDAFDPLPLLTQRAAQCALAIQQTLSAHRAADGTRLSLRVSVSAGEVRSLHLGGVFGRCEFVVAGKPLDEVGAACKLAAPGEVSLASSAWNLIGHLCESTPLADDAHLLRAMRLPMPLRTVAPLLLTPAAAAAVRGYIPAAVRARLEAGQSGWISEMRQVTVLFVNLPELHSLTPLEQGQQVMCGLQQTVYRYEGSINKLSVDDKGVTLVAALGLPPLAHENDPVRGVQAALAIRAHLSTLGWSGSIGVSTGRAFCGAYGSRRRREYTMIGDVVNLSARLMQAAHGSILCDEATYRAAQNRIAFERLPPISLKGKAGLVPIFQPLEENEQSPNWGGQEMVGRLRERETLTVQIQTLVHPSPSLAADLDHPAALVILEGEAGVGKSRLVADAMTQANAQSGLRLLMGGGDAVERSTPYFAWRQVFQQLLQLDAVPDLPEPMREHVIKQLQDDPELLRLAPLLSAVITADWPDNSFTAQMRGEVRGDNTNALLTRLLARAALEQPLMLILEDAHWLDSASWALIQLVRREVHPLLILLTSRPATEHHGPEYCRLVKSHGTLLLRLDGLRSEETAELICVRLGIRQVPADVVTLIHERAQGNPLFCEQLALGLREAGVIEIVEGRCRLTLEKKHLQSVYLPDTLQGVVTSRIDRLNPTQQLTLKVASVIGRNFSLRLLTDIYPMVEERRKLDTVLEELDRLRLVKLEAREPEVTYMFQHVITRDIIYDLMLEAQQRQLHKAVAEWLEQLPASELPRYYSLLAHHWAQARHTTQAMDYYEKAGEQALERHANEEATNFFREALRLALASEAESLPPVEVARIARWERQLGEAQYALGNMGHSLQHFQAALRLMEMPLPESGLGLALQSMCEGGRQLLHRFFPTRYVGRRQAEKALLLEAARAYERLTQIYYLNNAKLPCFHAALRTLNLTELAGPCAELARAYANASVLFGLLCMHGTARAHTHRAEATVPVVNNLSCSTYVFEVVGIYWYSVGDWERARSSLGSAKRLSEVIGELRRWDEILFPLAMIHHHNAEFNLSEDLATQMETSARRRGIIQVQCWGLSWQLVSLLPLNQTDPAVVRRVDLVVERLTNLLAEHAEETRALVRADEVLAYGTLARAHWRRGDHALALKMADEAMRLGRGSEPTSHYVLAGYAGVAEVYLGTWEKADDQVLRKREWRNQMREVCATLHAYARMHPVGLSAAWLYQGLFDWLCQRPRRARRYWQRSLASAEELSMPYEQGLAHQELSRFDSIDPHLGGMHRERAVDLFRQIGSNYHLYHLEQAQAEKEPSR